MEEPFGPRDGMLAEKRSPLQWHYWMTCMALLHGTLTLLAVSAAGYTPGSPVEFLFHSGHGHRKRLSQTTEIRSRTGCDRLFHGTSDYGACIGADEEVATDRQLPPLRKTGIRC